jgi:hypothetical protein
VKPAQDRLNNSDNTYDNIYIVSHKYAGDPVVGDGSQPNKDPAMTSVHLKAEMSPITDKKV